MSQRGPQYEKKHNNTDSTSWQREVAIQLEGFAPLPPPITKTSPNTTQQYKTHKKKDSTYWHGGVAIQLKGFTPLPPPITKTSPNITQQYKTHKKGFYLLATRSCNTAKRFYTTTTTNDKNLKKHNTQKNTKTMILPLGKEKLQYS